MNWEAIAAIAEVVGVIAVVLSLVYVGYQVNQNTQAMRLSAISTLVPEHNAHYRLVAENPELAELMMRAESEFESLSDLEKYRAKQFVMGLFVAAEFSYTDVELGPLAEQLEPMAEYWSRLMSNDVYREYWEENREVHEDRFRRFIDTVLRDRVHSA